MFIMKKLQILLLTFLCISVCYAGESKNKNKKTDYKSLIEKSDSFLQNQNFTGTVLIAKGDEIIFSKGYGTCNQFEGDTTPITPESRLEIGSITKQITASTVMQLEEQGKLSVNDKLSKYFPDYIYGDKITIKNLLTMSSGIENFYFSDEVVAAVLKAMQTNTTVEIDFWINELNKHPLAFTPGTKFDYDNLNFYLLAKIVEQVTGIPHNEYIEKNIFEPLGMTSSNMQTGAVDVQPYDKIPEPKHFPAFYSLGAGDINSTTPDLFKWIRGFVGGKIVNQNTIQEMTFNRKSDSPNYGYGLMYKNNKIFHIGSTFGYNSIISYNYDNDMTIIVLANRTQRSKNAETMEQVLGRFWK